MKNHCYTPVKWGRAWLTLILFVLHTGLVAQKNKPTADLEQFRNGSFTSPTDPGTWTTGNNGSSNSHYAEAMSAPYRVVMNNLAPNSEVMLILEYDVQHSGKLALDYLTSYDRIEPHVATFGHTKEEINPTVGTPLFQTPPESPSDLGSIPIPVLANSPVAGQPQTSFNTIAGAGQAQMAIWNGAINAIDYLGGMPDLSDPSNQSQQIQVSFTSGSDPSKTVILAWGGHLASRNDWGFDENGQPMSAGGISGSPYHMRLISWNFGNLGNQDLSLSIELVSAEIPPPSNFLAVGVSTTQIDLSWDEPATSESYTYTIERSDTENGPWIELVSGLPKGTTTYSDLGLEVFTQYYYRISTSVSGSSSVYATTRTSTQSDITIVTGLNGKSRNNVELLLLALNAGLPDGNPFDVYTLSEDGEDVLVEIVPVPSERENVVNDLTTTFGRVDSDFILGSAAIYITQGKNIIDVFFPISELLALRDDPRIKLVRNAYKPRLSNNGLGPTGVISQGDVSQTSDIVRESFNTKRENPETSELEVVPIDGSGVTCAIISDSWDQLPVSPGNPSRWETDQLNFDLPGPLNTNYSEFGSVDDLLGRGTDEGRAMGQIIHDVAPGTLLSFYTGFRSYNGFINAITQSSTAGNQIICEDLTYPQAPMLELVGPFFEAINDHVNRAVGNVYVHSSGNFKNDAIQGVFDPVPLPETSDMYPAGTQGYIHQFAPGDLSQEITFTAGADYIFVLQWLDAGGWASHGDEGAEVDLDLFITNNDYRVEAGNNFISFDKDPLEVAIVTSGTTRSANLVITCEGCTDPVPFRLIALKTSGPNGGVIFDEPWDAPTIAGAGLSEETITVGASFYGDYGVMESFSSFTGVLPNGINPQVTITGPDGANNSFLGVDTDNDEDIFPEFSGTSAAAPHVAGVMALALQALPSYYSGGLPPGILADPTYQTGDPADEGLGLIIQTAGAVDNPLQGGAGTTQAEEAFKLIASQTPQLLSFQGEEGKVISSEPVLVDFTGQYFVPDSKILLNGVELPTTYISPTELQAVVPPFSGGAPNSLAVSATPSITPSGFDGGAGPAIDLLLGRTAVSVAVADKFLEFGQDYSYSQDDLMITGLPEGETLESLGLPEVVITTTAQVIYPDFGFYTANAAFATPLTEEQEALYIFNFTPGVLSFTKKDLLMQGPELSSTYGDLSGLTNSAIIAATDYIYATDGIADNDDFLAKIREEHFATYYQESDGIAVLNRFTPVANENPQYAQALVQIIEQSNWMATETSITNRFTPVANDFNILELGAERLIQYLEEPEILEINPEQNRFTAVANGSDLVLGQTQLFDPAENRFTPVANRFTAVANRFSPVANDEIIPLGEDDDQTDYSRNLAIVDALDGAPEGTDPNELPSVNVFSINVISGKDVTSEGEEVYIGLGAPLSNFFYNFNWTTQAGRLTINPLPITVDLDDQDEPFLIMSGEELPTPFTSTITPSLAYQDQANIEYSVDPQPAQPIEAGKYSIVQSVSIQDPDEADKTFNYDITTFDGQVFVNLAEGKRIRVYLDCVAENKGSSDQDFPYTAYFRYENDNNVSLFIEAMSEANRVIGTSFDPSSVPFEFLPGSHQFPVPFVGEIRYEVASFGSVHQTSQQVDSEDLKGWICKPKDIVNGRTANLELEGNNQPAADQQQFDQGNLGFYPNPVIDKLTVRVPENFGADDYELYSSTGIQHDIRAVFNSGASTVEFDFSSFETGLYLLKLNIEGTSAIIRVLRE